MARFLFLALALCLPSVTEARRPNFILVFVDDMGWGDFSCFGNKTVKTENIDKLASEGLRFEQFYVNSPICSPSRVAISTGQYPQRWRISSYLASRELNEQRGMAQWLDPQAPMLARILNNHEYSTGHFGKWHMGGQRDVGEAPLITDYGFDKSLTNFEGLGPRVLAVCDAHDGTPVRRHTLGSDKLGRGKIIWEDRDKVTKSYVNAAIDFIKESESKDKPFYINVWPDDVHSPFYPPEAKRGDGSKRQLYHGVLDTMDQQLGLLFDYVRNRPTLHDNTLILVCSDNGPEQGAGSAGPFRGYKTWLYEGGIRSSLVVWGPGLVDTPAAGQVNLESFFAAIDIPPTLLAIAGIKPPASAQFDGHDMTDVLLGNSKESRPDALCFRRPPDRNSFYGNGNLPDLAIRQKEWKLVCDYDGKHPELYNLAEDRGETNNVAADHPSLVETLRKIVVDWHLNMPPDNGATFVSKKKGNRKPQESKAGTKPAH